MTRLISRLSKVVLGALLTVVLFVSAALADDIQTTTLSQGWILDSDMDDFCSVTLDTWDVEVTFASSTTQENFGIFLSLPDMPDSGEALIQFNFVDGGLYDAEMVFEDGMASVIYQYTHKALGDFLSDLSNERGDIDIYDSRDVYRGTIPTAGAAEAFDAFNICYATLTEAAQTW